MTYMEMFLVVMAIVLLSTIAIMHHNTMATAADLVTNASHTVQAMQVAQELLDSIDARLMAPSTTGWDLNRIATVYGDTITISRYLEHYQAAFEITAKADPCNDYGDTNAHPDSMFNYLVTVRVREVDPGGASSGQRHSVTQSRVYTAYSLQSL